ncbi:unnamed protein product [Schistosoma turkestanicum]|nr:unnamed protein product [Schistosoma turkestanicum]
MEGILLKWTNYVSGWQQRYFILNDGVLSYYRSKEEMNSGCKGSVKLSVCDVIVHSSDPRRFDLILGEQRYYLRALSRADRQRWVIALGSSKVSTPSYKSEDVNIYEPSQTQLIDNHRSELRLYHNLMVQQVKEIQSHLKEGTIPDMDRIDELTGMLNASCSTFLIALDELMILSHAQAPWLSSIVTPTGSMLDTTSSNVVLQNTSCFSSNNNNVDIGNLHSPTMSGFHSPLMTNDSKLRNSHTHSSLNRRHFNATRKYQTFFSTLEYSFEDIRPSLPTQSNPDNDEIKLPGDYLSALEFVKASKCLLHFLDRFNPTHQTHSTIVNNKSCPTTTTPTHTHIYVALKQAEHCLLNYLNCIEYHVEMHCTTLDMNNNRTTDNTTDNATPTTPTTTTIIDELNKTSLVENNKSNHDITNNHCNVLFKKAQLSLGDLLRYEMKHNGTTVQDNTNNNINNHNNNNNSVYMSILWLCRWLNFVREFLHHLFHSPDQQSTPINYTLNSDINLVTIANEAYTRCLRPFHTWSIRGMAMVIMQSLPSRSYLFDLLLADNPDTMTSSPTTTTSTTGSPYGSFNEPASSLLCIRYPEAYIQLKLDATRYSEALGRCLTLIEGLLASLDLNRIFTGLENIVKSYDRATGTYTDHVEFPQNAIMAYKDSDFVACIVDSILIVYWINLNVSVRYLVPTSEKHAEKKKYTCIAAHPNDQVIATGNGIGEIFIWWNLCTQTDGHFNLLNPASDEWAEKENCTENDAFDDAKNAIKKCFAEGRLLTYYPVHPSHVKRSLLHWHSVQVTSLCFTPCGTHLLSGGLEGVLVKWDMTDCFGGPQQRRFLPHFGSPISSVRSHGGVCEDMISVNLANNSFHIMDGAFTIIYSNQGFMQLPKYWFPIRSSLKIPTNLMILQNKLSSSMNNDDDVLSSTCFLTNGGCGKLQLTNVIDGERHVQKIDITHQNFAVRNTDTKHPIMYTEVLFIAQLCTEMTFTWFVTYECVNMSTNDSSIDDQSRLTWWQCSNSSSSSKLDEKNVDNVDVASPSVDGIHNLVKFTSVDTYSLSHFGCPVVSMEFVPSEKNQLYTLFKDYRLMIWNYNSEYSKNPIYSPWIPASCHLLSYANPNRSILPPTSLIIPFNVQSNTKQCNTSTSLLVCSDLDLTLMNWDEILLESNPKIAASVCFKKNLLKLWPDAKKIMLDKCVIVFSPTSDVDHDISRYLAVTIRGYCPTSISERISHGALCLVKCTPSSVEIISIVPDVLATCITSHPSKPYLAVGLGNGTVTIFEVQFKANIQLNSIHSLPNLIAQPLCDRKHYGGEKKKHKMRNPNGTLFVSLCFISSNDAKSCSDHNDNTDKQYHNHIQLAGLMKTLVGRETGRYDLVYYGTRTKMQKNSTETTTRFNVQSKQQGLLQLVDTASPVKFDNPVRVNKRKLNSDIQLENTLKQISEYPIYTAPPPDQLLHQLMMRKH